MSTRSQPLSAFAHRTGAPLERDQALHDGIDVSCRPDPIMFEDAVENGHDCMALVDLDGTIAYVNFAGLCQFGLESARPRESWSELWSSECLDLVEYGLESARAGHSCRIIAHRDGPRGATQWWDIGVSPVFHRSGSPVQMFCVCRDVTAAKRLESAIESAAIAKGSPP